MNKFTKSSIFNLIKLLLVFALTALFFVLAIKAAGLLAPFVLGLICAVLMEPIIRLLTKLHIKKIFFPRSLASIITMLIAGIVVGIGLAFLLNIIIVQLVELVKSLPSFLETLLTQMQNIFISMEDKLSILPEQTALEITDSVYKTLNTYVKELSGLVNPLAKGVWSTALRLPNILLFIVMWLVGTFYMCSWRMRIGAFLKKEIPSHWIERVIDMKDRLFSTLFGYLRAQLVLMLLVFLIVLVGLSILGVPYTLLLALIIALFDALPAIGSGLFLNTWAAYCLITGNPTLAIGLFLTYIAVLVGRNVAEPRLVSVQIGLPPLLTMIAMYTGFRLIGFLGLIGGPVLMVIMNIVYGYYAHGRTLKDILMGTSSSNAKSAVEDS